MRTPNQSSTSDQHFVRSPKGSTGSSVMSMNKGLTSARWLPILMGLVVAILTAFIWKALDRQESAQIVQMGQLAAASVKSEILAQMESQTLALVRVAKRWEYLAGTPRGAWEADAKHYTAHNPGSQAVEWVDPSSRVRWIVPLDGNEAALDLDLPSRRGGGPRLRLQETAAWWP